MTDLVRKKIYNLWVLPGFAAGMLLSFVSEGIRGFSGALAAALLAFMILFPVYLAGGIGAGDVKLFAAAAVWLNFGEVCMCIMVSFLIGAAYGLIKLAVMGRKDMTIRFAVPILISIFFIFGGKL
ncbi:MAG: prepilin peptidase [Lachnospiraceae bacterium]|nr:prepilin peptidase [Lachnospiraceae bacterium]